jgi:hypothetical protein
MRKDALGGWIVVGGVLGVVLLWAVAAPRLLGGA